MLDIDRSALVDVAMGRRAADVAICGGRLVNVFTREIYAADVLIYGQRIAAVLNAGASPIEARTVIQARGRFLSPGFIDPHMHIESSGLTVAEFARAIVPRGTTTVIADPHEFGNVLGKPGMDLVLEDARDVPLNVLLRVPPRIPELPSYLETPGATVTEAETLAMLTAPSAACLAGDISNLFYLNNDPALTRLIAATVELRKTVSGMSLRRFDRELNAYVSSGAEDSQTPLDLEELLEDIRAGITCFLTPRPRRFERDQFRALAEHLRSHELDTRKICFCTDDIQANKLLSLGHLDYRIRMAIDEGLSPVTAIQMATLNPATAMRIDRDYGVIAAGRFADILLIDNLEKLTISSVVHHGRLVLDGGALLQETRSFRYPPFASRTINIERPLYPRSLQLRTDSAESVLRCRTIEVGGARKKSTIVELPVIDGYVGARPEADVAYVAVLERYHKTGNVGRGFVKNTCIRRGALASSVNHNVHHIYAVGQSHADMAIALERLIDIGGGYVAVLDGKVIGELALPIVGMISELTLEELAAEYTRMEEVLRDGLGCDNGRNLESFNFLCSPVSLEVGITDLGLINGMTLQLEPVIVDYAEGTQLKSA